MLGTICINIYLPGIDLTLCFVRTSTIFPLTSCETFPVFFMFSSNRNSTLIALPSAFLAVRHLSLFSATTSTVSFLAGASFGNLDARFTALSLLSALLASARIFCVTLNIRTVPIIYSWSFCSYTVRISMVFLSHIVGT